MTSPRTPRQWTEGSEEPPADVTRLRGASGEDDVVRCGTGWWIVAPGEGPVVPDSFADGFRWRAGASIPTRLWPLSEVLPETPEPPREDGPRSDAPTLWRRLQVAARVIKAFKPEDPSPELLAFLRDIRDAVDGDLLEDELSGDLMRFARGQGRLLTALLASQDTEERA